ncbi:hypothetical protein ABZ684_33005 [Streptomyces sp. NPDC006995]|uniref:hypothetical protein n=1 Tax=Streptomyces sp. NPDC006995 TaxID=3156907 RepID=UPI0033EE0722
MTDAANTPPATRAARVLTTVFVVITVAYMGLMTFISVPELTHYKPAPLAVHRGAVISAQAER